MLIAKTMNKTQRLVYPNLLLFVLPFASFIFKFFKFFSQYPEDSSGIILIYILLATRKA